MSFDVWARREERVRDKLFSFTRPIPSEDIAGLLFGIGLVASDHLFRTIYGIQDWFALVRKLTGE